MLERARSLLLEFPEYRSGRVCELGEPGIGHQVEYLFEQIYQRIACDRQHGCHEQAQKVVPEDAFHHPGQPQRGICESHGKEIGHGQQELLPALNKVARGVYGHQTACQEYDEQGGSLLGIDQQRQQRHDVDRDYHPGPHERLKVQRRQRKGHHEQPLRIDAAEHQDDEREQCEDEDDIVIPVLQEEALSGKQYHHPQHRDKHQRHQKVAQDSQIRRAGGTDVGLVFLLVGVQYLGYLRSHDLSLGNDELPGGDVSAGRRNAVSSLGIHELGRLGVVNQIGNNLLIDEVRPEYGIRTGRDAGGLHVRLQFRAGGGDAENLDRRHLYGTFVLLDVNHVGAHGNLIVGHHSFLHDSLDGCHHERLELPKFHSGDGLEARARHTFRVFVIRHVSVRRLVHFRLHLLRRLEDGEIERSEQGLILPHRPLLVIVAELCRTRCDGCEQSCDEQQRQDLI